MHFNFDAPVLEAFDELNKLDEGLKTFKISYYEDGVKKSFTVQASSKAEAEQIGWSRVDADSLYVSEVVNEAATPAQKTASKKFWAAAGEGRMDEEAFHTAFDEELTELGLMDMFDADGVLENNYSRIAEAKKTNPDSWGIKALGKLWALRYKERKLFKSEREKAAAAKKADEEERIRKYKAEMDAKDAAKAARIKEAEDLFKSYLSKVDAETASAYEQLTGRTVADGVYLKHEGDAPRRSLLDKVLFKYGIYIRGWNRYYPIIETDLTDEAAVLTRVNAGLKKVVETITEKNTFKELLNEFNSIDLVAKGRHPDIILRGESGTLYHIDLRPTNINVSINGEPFKPLTEKIPEAYEVIYLRTGWSDGNNRTTRDSHSADYYSWNSKYAAELAGLIPTKFGRVNGYIGSYTETTKMAKPDADSKNYSLADGIDSWAEVYNVDGATD